MECLSVIILNWNNAADTIECIRSVQNSTYRNFHILVVDNGSVDGSAAAIRSEFPSIEVLETGENLGYAGGNNFGIKKVLAKGGRRFLLLNNDTTIDNDALYQLELGLSEKPDAAIATPMILEYSDPERIFCLGARINLKRMEIERLHAGERYDSKDWIIEDVDIAAGSAIFFDCRVIDEIGMMDEDYFLYFEETDWCQRAIKSGIKIISIPQAKIWHKVSASLNKDSPIITYYMTRNALRFCQRNFSKVQMAYCQTIIIFNALRSWLSEVRRGDRANASARLAGIRDYIKKSFGQKSFIERAIDSDKRT